MSTILGNPITLGGGGGNELIVTAPTGSTVTATKGSITKTATEKNGTWTFKGLEAGNWTVTAVKGSESASSVVTVSAETVTLSFKPTASLTAKSGVTYTNGISGISAEKMSLYAEAISNNASITNRTSVVYIDDGVNHYKISVGDKVTLALSGTNYTFDVIGFNHDTLATAAAYGANTATGKAGMTLQMHDLFATTYSMNNSNTSRGGWKNSAMRTSIMAGMKGYLPDDWEAIIKPVNKDSGTGHGSSSGTETVQDSCFLLSEIEIFGRTTYSVSGEGTQYAYYNAGNTKVKNFKGSADYWWERSPYSGDTGVFCCVGKNGNANYHAASERRGVSFGFCV